MVGRAFFRDTMDLHQRLQDLITAMEVEYDAAEMSRLLKNFLGLLIPHVQTEEEVLYTTLDAVVDHGEDRNVLLEAHQEHRVILRIVEEMQDTPPGSDDFQGMVLLLGNLMARHIEQEEEALYDIANRYLDYAAFSELSKRMHDVQERRLKEHLEMARHPRRSRVKAGLRRKHVGAHGPDRSR